MSQAIEVNGIYALHVVPRAQQLGEGLNCRSLIFESNSYWTICSVFNWDSAEEFGSTAVSMILLPGGSMDDAFKITRESLNLGGYFTNDHAEFVSVPTLLGFELKCFRVVFCDFLNEDGKICEFSIGSRLYTARTSGNLICISQVLR